MLAASNDLTKLILDSKALSIWDHKTGPVFWYIAGVPGPFYLNTELMIGRELSDRLLEKITAIVADHVDVGERAVKLETLMMEAYRSSADYQAIVRAMIDKVAGEFPKGSFDAISGGERRDWLFSIPLAAEMGLKHIYLFKNKAVFCQKSLEKGEKALHVSDLINNAASYFDLWLPSLKQSDLICAGTITVNTRGSAGVKRLEKAGYKVAALNRIDLAFFEQCCVNGLIERDVVDEIALFFQSDKEWGGRYLMGREDLFNIAKLDKKSFERAKSFFERDPWGLRGKYGAFFERMRVVIAGR